MKQTLLQLIFGIGLTMTAIVTCLSIGLFSDAGAFGSGNSALLAIFTLLAVGQLLAFVAMRQGTALKVLLGFAIWQLLWWLIYFSRWPLFWEPPNSDGSLSVSWRTYVAALVLLGVSLAIPFLVAQWAKFRMGSKPPTT